LQYVFSLQCTTADNYASQAEMGVTINSPPKSQAAAPQCVVTPSQGRPIVDKFSFKCVQFSDVDTPLTYQFGFEIQGVSDVSSSVCV
jgi:hypothetical protein